MVNNLIFIAEGILITLKYSILSVFFGFIIGTILAIFKVSHYKLLSGFANLYTSVFRGTPLLLQLSIIYFGIPTVFKIKLGVFIAGVIAFSLNSGAYVSEIVRAGINSVDKGQIEAGKALNIPYHLIMKDIIIPQAVRNMLPSLVNELINMLKESAIISILGEMDIMRRGQIIAMQKYQYFTPMLLAASCYYLLVLIFSSVAKCLEKRYKL